MSEQTYANGRRSVNNFYLEPTISHFCIPCSNLYLYIEINIFYIYVYLYNSVFVIHNLPHSYHNSNAHENISLSLQLSF